MLRAVPVYSIIKFVTLIVSIFQVLFSALTFVILSNYHNYFILQRKAAICTFVF